MLNGARLAAEFVAKPDVKQFLTVEQAMRVVHLVGIHDDLHVLKDIDEIILMEADTLGAIDTARVKPSFNLEGRMKYLEAMKIKRATRFQTELGKKLLSELIPQFETYRDERDR